MVRRLARGKRISGIESRIVALNHARAVKFIGSSFREDFDARVSELVVFRRKWIRIDANFADRGFGRQLPGGEPVNVHLPAVWPGSWAGKGLQILRKLIRIIGKRIKVFAF